MPSPIRINRYSIKLVEAPATKMAAVLAEWIFFSLLLLCVQTCSAHVRRVSGLPLITVYLLAGALARVTGLLGREKPWGTASLHSGALGLISVAAGAELELESVRAQARVILCLTLSLTISALLIVGIARGGLICRCERRCEQTGWGCELPEKVRSAGALLSATVAVARSPSSAIALVQELGADGVFTQTLLGVTMVTDLLVVVLFAVTAEVVALTLPGEDAPPTSAGLSAPASPRKIDVATDTAVGGNAPLGRLANEGKRSATDVFTGGFGEESELQGLHEGAPPPHAMAIATPRELTDVVGERTTLQSSFAAFVVIARVVGHVLLQLVCSVALGAVVGWVVLCVARLPRSRHWKVVRSATRISVSHAAAWLANPPFLRLQCTFTHQLTIPTPLIPWKLRLLALLAVGSFAFNAEELATRVIRRFRGAEAEVAMPLVWEGDAAHRRLGSVPLIEPMLVCMVAGLLGRNFPHRLYNLPRIALHGLRFASAHALQRCGQRRAKRLSPAVIDGSKTSLLESALADGLPDASDIQTYGWSSGEGGRERRRHSTVNSAELTQLLHDAMPKVRQRQPRLHAEWESGLEREGMRS